MWRYNPFVTINPYVEIYRMQADVYYPYMKIYIDTFYYTIRSPTLYTLLENNTFLPISTMEAKYSSITFFN